MTTTVVMMTPNVRLSNPVWKSGVYTAIAAQVWGERSGYATVYWSKKTGRVYAEKGGK